jgi:hypothetical protein
MYVKRGICKAEILSCNLTNDRQEEVKLYEVGRAKIFSSVCCQGMGICVGYDRTVIEKYEESERFVRIFDRS